MKKSLLALAALGTFAGAAHAQSSVTLYGILDAAMQYVIIPVVIISIRRRAATFKAIVGACAARKTWAAA
jgi:ABC-type antimicrobial peptide transport system permease subunit